MPPLVAKEGEAPKTLRARLEQHRSKPGCNQCHGVIDPIGLAMENFDAIGRWRRVDAEANNTPINASTVLPNGKAIDGPAELRSLASSINAMLARLGESAADRERALAATQRFAADAGHELRTPLMTVQATLSALSRHPDMSADQQTSLVDDLRAGARASIRRAA